MPSKREKNYFIFYHFLLIANVITVVCRKIFCIEMQPVIVGNKLPNKLLLQGSSLVGPSMRGCTKAGGDSITIGSFGHAIHHPITTRLHTGPCGLIQVDPHSAVMESHRGHLPNGQALSAETDDRAAVLGDHPLDLVDVAPFEPLGRGRPVEWILEAKPIERNVAIVAGGKVLGWFHYW